ncbi:MAG: TRAP-type C4-dicarboxylate transport system substrate-binding protein, partial [Myxococcota bacterium]
MNSQTFRSAFFRAALTVLLTCGLAAPAMADGPIVIKMATLAPANSAWMKVFKAAASEIEEKSKGRVKIKIYGGGSRGDEKVVIDKMKSGQLQGAAITSVGLAQIAPEVLVLQTPGLINNYKQLDYVREKLSDRFEKAFAKQGFKLVGWGDVGYTYLLSKTPVKTPDDLKNAKPWVWSSDPVMAELYKLAGAQATPLPVPEVLQNLTTGVIESFYGSPLAAIALQWFTHAKYITNKKLAIGIGATVVTLKVWNQASAEEKVLIESINEEWHKILIKK